MAIAALDPLEVTVIAIHSSRTGEQDLTVVDIDRMHRDQGRLCIGYHFVIRKDGTVEEGRPLTKRGSHLPDRNHCSVGICIVGGISTQAQDEAIDELLTNLEQVFPDTALEDYT